MKTKKIAFPGIFISFAMILSYLESLLPPLTAIPGVKIGLANIAVIIVLFRMGLSYAFAVSLIRILLISVLFTNPVSVIYSVTGAVLSLCGMALFKKTKTFSTVGISVVGGILHNFGQICAAILLVETAELLYYLPVLLISGTLAGIFVGVVSAFMIKRIEKIKI